MARDAGVEGALRADQHWLPEGTMQVGSHPCVSVLADTVAVCTSVLLSDARCVPCAFFLVNMQPELCMVVIWQVLEIVVSRVKLPSRAKACIHACSQMISCSAV